jgi:hypothetical protein
VGTRKEALRRLRRVVRRAARDGLDVEIETRGRQVAVTFAYDDKSLPPERVEDLVRRVMAAVDSALRALGAVPWTRVLDPAVPPVVRALIADMEGPVTPPAP